MEMFSDHPTHPVRNSVPPKPWGEIGIPQLFNRRDNDSAWKREAKTMKWIWLTLLGVAAPLFILLAIGLTLYRPGLPIAAQKSLDMYMAQHGSGAEPLRVQATGRAAHPSALGAELSNARFGDTYYFGVAGRPAPFPPTEAWCATLAGAGEPYTVLVAQHEDLHVGAWFVHEVDAQAAATVCR
jgi:hypothetical protein